MRRAKQHPILLAVVLLASCSPPEPAPDRQPACRQVNGSVGMRWYIPVADRARLDAWCGTVGPPAMDLSGDSATTDSPDSFVIITWNVHVGAGDLERFIRDLRAGRFTNGQPVRHFVLLLQEALRISGDLPAVAANEVPHRVFAVDARDSTRTEIVRAARQLGLSYLYVPSMRNGAGGEERGNAIVSTLRIEHPVAIELPIERQRRVAIAAAVEAGDTILEVVSVHLENRSQDVLKSFGAGRLRQATAMMQVLSRNTPAVVGGDFNTWFLTSAEPTLHYVRERFPQTPDTDVGATHRPLSFLGRTTDHLFFRLPRGWQIVYRRIDDAYGSDHFPVIGIVRRL